MINMIKKLFMILCISCCLVACSQDDSYTRDSSEGKREFITLSEMGEKIENEDSFVIVLAQSTCGSCNQFNSMAKEYLTNHNVTIYEVILDFEETTVDENIEIINRYFTNFSNTPAIYYVENGKQKDKFELKSSTISEQEFDEWVVEHKLDKKE